LLIRNIGYHNYLLSEISGIRNIRYQKYLVSEISGIRNIDYQKYPVFPLEKGGRGLRLAGNTKPEEKLEENGWRGKAMGN